MQFASPHRNRRDVGEPNVTSLVDIIFILLLFFVLTTTFRQDTSAGLMVDLPAASAADAPTTKQDMVIALLKDGKVIVAGAALSQAALDEALATFKRATPQGLVIIQADAEVPHGRVVEVIDRIKAIGLASVAIATQGG